MPLASRRYTGNGMVIRYDPVVITGFAAVFALSFITPLGGLGALLFLVSGMVLMVGAPGAVLAGLRQNPVLIVMVLWCVTSALWSAYPALTLRYGIQLLLTIMIATTLCRRLSPTSFVKVVLLAQTIAGIASLASGRTRGDGMGFLGLYNSKNALATSASVLIIVALAVLLDRRMGGPWRILGAVGLIIGAVLLVLGQSVGAIITVLAAIIGLLVILIFCRLSVAARVVFSIAVVAVMATVAAFISLNLAGLADWFTEVTGKDLTLTGRTELWAVALDEIAQRPFLGAGFQAVWVHGNPLAEHLWEKFGIAARGGFNFHNTLISNAVEIGLIGIVLQAVLVFGALLTCLRWSIRQPSAISLFLALFMIRQAISMQAEVVFFFQFSLTTLITVAAISYGTQYNRMAARGQRYAPRIRRPHTRIVS